MRVLFTLTIGIMVFLGVCKTVAAEMPTDMLTHITQDDITLVVVAFEP